MHKLIICTDGNLGDSICAMAAIQIVAARTSKVFIMTANLDTELPMRPNNAFDITRLPQKEIMDVVHLDIGTSFQKNIGMLRGRYSHPVIQYLHQAGIHDVDTIPQPKISLMGWFNPEHGKITLSGIRQFDYLIAPFSKDLSRVWPEDNYPALFEALREISPGCTIGILGDMLCPRPWKGVEYIYGYDLSSVVQMMRICKEAVITIDSGPNRVAHLAGITNHIILNPDHLPPFWVGHPGSVNLIGSSETWTVQQIIEGIKQMHAINAGEEERPCLKQLIDL